VVTFEQLADDVRTAEPRPSDDKYSHQAHCSALPMALESVR
jgi:hypothetical protein